MVPGKEKTFLYNNNNLEKFPVNIVKIVICDITS